MTTVSPTGPREWLLSIGATTAIVALVVVWPLVLFERITEIADSQFAYRLRPIDTFLGAAGLLWAGVVASLFAIRRPLRPVRGVSADLQAGFRTTTARSLFGVGLQRSWTTTNPDVGLEHVILENARVESFPDGDSEVPMPAVADAVEEQPVAEIPQLVTESYVVQRGDTWWTLAEARLGDGREWTLIEQLNFGREVAPGVQIEGDKPLTPGWQILLPVATEE